MIILLYGPDTYGRLKKSSELRDSIVERNPEIILGSFDMEQDEHLIALHEFASAPGLFSQGKRFCFVKNSINIFNNDVFQNILNRVSGNKDIILVLSESREKKLDKKEESFCKKNEILIQFFGKPTELELKKRIEKHAISLGVDIDKKAIDFLIEIYGNESQAIITDIEKWSSITKNIDIKFLLGTGEYISEIGFFDFSQTILFNKSLREKLRAFEHIISQGNDLFAIFNIIAKATGSYELINALADADIKIKKGLIEIDQAITALVLG